MDKFQDCIYKDMCDQTCKQACMRYVEMKYMLKYSNIPKAKQKVNSLVPDTCDIKAFENLASIRNSITEFTENGHSLYIYSTTCGNGKTTWAIKLMLQYFHECWAGNGFTKRGVFVNVPTFLYTCKSIISKPDENFEELRQSLFDVDLVIWDDIAAAKMSDYDFGILLAFIDNRVLNEKANIYTGNIEPNNLEQFVGTKLASRILEGDKICLRGGDKRYGSVADIK